jgi:hypothetical protein
LNQNASGATAQRAIALEGLVMPSVGRFGVGAIIVNATADGLAKIFSG